MKKLFLLVLTVIVAISAVACSKSDYNPTVSPSVISAEKFNDVCTPDVQEPYADDTVLKFVACGDNIMYTGNFRDAKKCAVNGGREYNFAPIYENVRSLIEGADIAFINQETPMAGAEFGYSSYPQFNCPQDLAFDLVDAGFDIINIANNHMLDAGSNGLESTIKFWQTMPVTLVGGYLGEDDFNNIRVFEKDDVKIALLSYTYGTNGFKVRSDYNLWIPYLNEETVRRQVAEAQKLGDLVFVSVHWGNENNMTPSDEQTYLAAAMAELGVDVIIGHHPHVIQPVKWLNGTDGHKTLCIYSLGNFAAEMSSDYNLLGAMMTFDISRKSGKYSIENPILIPTVYYYTSSFYKNSVHFLDDFNDSMASSVGLSYYGHSTTRERLCDYVTDTIDAEFLPDFLK